MPPSLMASQHAALEPLGPDEDGVLVEVTDEPHALVERIVAALAEPTPTASGSIPAPTPTR